MLAGLITSEVHLVFRNSAHATLYHLGLMLGALTLYWVLHDWFTEKKGKP